jgi:voltage-gated potassium channel
MGDRQLFDQLKLPIALIFCLLMVGTAGYRLIEGWSFLDSLYMTIITLSTVGYREIETPSPLGKAFTIGLIVFGVVTAGFAVRVALEFAISERAQQFLWRRKMRGIIDKLSDHFIVCGYGRMGREVSQAFVQRGIPHVVVDQSPERLFELIEADIPSVCGDATADETLQEAGIETARGLVAVTDTDAENTFITLSARSMNAELLIVARAEVPETERKLQIAGADRVVSPYVIGGRRLAAAATQPTVVDYLDAVMHGGPDVELAMRELAVEEGAELHGKTLGESKIREKSGAVVVAMKDTAGVMHSNPRAGHVICAGDILICVGTTQEFETLTRMCTGP